MEPGSTVPVDDRPYYRTEITGTRESGLVFHICYVNVISGPAIIIVIDTVTESRSRRPPAVYRCRATPSYSDSLARRPAEPGGPRGTRPAGGFRSSGVGYPGRLH